MTALIEVILPVFLVIGAGYLAVWFKLFSDTHVDGLMQFTQQFAIPALLFMAMVKLDLSGAFSVALLGSYFGAAFLNFLLGFFGARWLFRRPWEDCIAIGFIALVANTFLLGLPITEQAYGAQALEGNYAIIALHSPVTYGFGIIAMQIARARGGGMRRAAAGVVRDLSHNALVIGIVLGLAVNLLGIGLPGPVESAVSLFARSALPAALFGLGGVMVRYKPEGDLRVVLYLGVLSLLVQPALAYGFSVLAGLERDAMRSVVLTAAMAPGVNTYIFANMYGVARRVAASSVLLITAASVLTVWLWLIVLP